MPQPRGLLSFELRELLSFGAMQSGSERAWNGRLAGLCAPESVFWVWRSDSGGVPSSCLKWLPDEQARLTSSRWDPPRERPGRREQPQRSDTRRS